MWYVIQTMTGREDELLLLMRTVLKKDFYEECFVLRSEWMKRLGGAWRVQVRPLFPGYVFVDTMRPDEVFQALKTIPRLSRILGDGDFEFIPLERGEEKFFQKLLGEDGYLIRLSTVEIAEDGTVAGISGVLRQLEENIVQMNLHKRYAIVSMRMLGRERTTMLGLKLHREDRK